MVLTNHGIVNLCFLLIKDDNFEAMVLFYIAQAILNTIIP